MEQKISMFNNDTPPLQRIYRGPRMAFLVLGRTLIGSVVPEVPYLVISVTDPERSEASLAASPLCRAVLRLQFHDTSQTVDIPGLEGLSLGNETAMTAADARIILDFATSCTDQVELIVCQCEAGVSRSAGIAAALSRLMQNEDAFFFEHYWPNHHVYTLLLQEAARRQEQKVGEQVL